MENKCLAQSAGIAHAADVASHQPYGERSTVFQTPACQNIVRLKAMRPLALLLGLTMVAWSMDDLLLINNPMWQRLLHNCWWHPLMGVATEIAAYFVRKHDESAVRAFPPKEN